MIGTTEMTIELGDFKVTHEPKGFWRDLFGLTWCISFTIKREDRTNEYIFAFGRSYKAALRNLDFKVGIAMRNRIAPELEKKGAVLKVEGRGS